MFTDAVVLNFIWLNLNVNSVIMSMIHKKFCEFEHDLFSSGAFEDGLGTIENLRTPSITRLTVLVFEDDLFLYLLFVFDCFK